MFQKIAVATDGSETAAKAVEAAADLAIHYQAPLVVLSAYTPVPHSRVKHELEGAPDDIQWAIGPREDVDEMLTGTIAQIRERGVEVSCDAAEGEAGTVVCELAAQHDVDLLVIGNKGIDRKLFGSVPKTISQHAPCSVVIVKTT